MNAMGETHEVELLRCAGQAAAIAYSRSDERSARK
jgi:hypothetical protein